MVSESRSWTGEGVLYDGRSARPQRVQVRVEPDRLRVETQSGEMTLSVSQVRITDRRAGTTVRLELEPFPDGALLLQAADAVAALDGWGHSRHGPTRRGAIRVAGGLGVLALLLILFLTWGVDRIVDVGIRLVPEGAERQLGSRVYDALVAGRTVLQDPQIDAVLGKCTHLLRSFGARNAADLQITLIDDASVVNAFALPGGRIVLFRGMLEFVHDEDELLGLLAHELAHVHYRHGVRHVARKAVVGFVFATFFGEVNGISAILLDNGSALLDLAYNRNEERAADAFAVDALARAGFDPRGIMALFTRIGAQRPGEPPALLSTHPSTRSRIEQLERRIAALPARVAARQPVFAPDEWRTLTARSTTADTP